MPKGVHKNRALRRAALYPGTKRHNAAIDLLAEADALLALPDQKPVAWKCEWLDPNGEAVWEQIEEIDPSTITWDDGPPQRVTLLYAAPPDLQARVEWAPVESGLPESGQAVLLTIENERGKRKVIRAQYAAKHTLEQSPECDGGYYDEETDTYWCEEGWYEWNEFDEIHRHVSDKTIAWTSLPKPYAAQESGK